MPDFRPLPTSRGTNQIEAGWNVPRASTPAIQQITGNKQFFQGPVTNETPHVNPISRNSTDHISITTESFFEFIAQIIKNTLLTVSENKEISVESIIAQSATANLGIPIVWRESHTDEQREAMDLSKTSEPQTS